MGFIYILLFSFKEFFSSFLNFSPEILSFLLLNAYFLYVRNLLVARLRSNFNHLKASIILLSSSLLCNFLSLLFIFLFYQSNPLIGYVLGNLIGVVFITVLFITDLTSRARLDIKSLFTYWSYGLKISIPLSLAVLSNLINSQSDRLILRNLLGDSIAGFYSLAYQFGLLFTIIFHSFDVAWSPWIFKQFSNNKFDLIINYGKAIRNFFIVLFIFLYFFLTFFARLIIPSTYYTTLEIIPTILIGFFFNFLYTFQVKIELFLKKNLLISTATLITAVLNIILNLIFIPIYGFFVAAVTTAVSYLFQFLFHYYISVKVLGFELFNYKFHLISFTFLILSIILRYLFINNVLVLIIVFLCFTYYLFLDSTKIIQKSLTNK
jgi:O-antigen/teichoic acid export membrane protein